MKVSEAIALADKYAGEPIDSELKYVWLSQIEDMIYSEIVMAHEDPPEKPLPVLSGDRELICPEPYSVLYIHYINMQNDLYLRDTQNYANSASAFAAAYSSYADMYNRSHAPVSEAGDISL